MTPSELGLVAATFLFAGFAKGLVGLGLPPVAIALLTTTFTPLQAASLVVVPSFLSNFLQAARGGHMIALLKRFWPVIVFTIIGTLVFPTALADHPSFTRNVFGILMIAYAAYSLLAPSAKMPRRYQGYVGVASGFATGVLTAFTGVSAMPSVPFFESLRLSRAELLQILGISFCASSMALGIILQAEATTSIFDLGTAIATIACLIGMLVGSKTVCLVDERNFRRIFLFGLIGLGFLQLWTAM